MQYAFDSKKRWKHLARFFQIALVKSISIGRLFGSYIGGARVPRNLGHEAGGRFYYSGSPDSQEHRARPQRCDNPLHLKGHFAEPTDMRANISSAITAGQFRRRLIGIAVREWQPATMIAAALEKLSVHVQYPSGAGLFVEAIDVLRAQEQAIRDLAF
jgi:hypothetical protein